MENRNSVSHKLAEEMYKGGATPGASGPGTPRRGDRATAGGADQKKNEDVIDAEYEAKE